MNFPSLRLSSRSFLAGRERRNTPSALIAEHNGLAACSTHPEETGMKYSGKGSCAAPGLEVPDEPSE